MLQETHLTKEETLKLKQRWVGQIFFSPGTKASRGVCILISKMILFTALEVFSDKDGRWVIVSGELQSNKVTLVNLYAPNMAQSNLVSLLNMRLAQFQNTPLLVGGDFNLVNDAIVDRSGHPLPADKALSRAFKELLETQSLTDVWRLVNSQSREYTFYSRAHNSYSRIDYLLLSNDLLDSVVDTTIHSITISDHAPVSLSFYPSSKSKIKSKRWSFNNSLLKDDTFVELIQQKIKEFIELNITPDIPIQTVWEAFKATCRGWIIRFSSYKNKK